MKFLTISQMILRVAVLLALIIGIVFWINPGLPAQSPAVKGIHMLLGIIVVLALWAVGVAQTRLKGGSVGMAIGAFIIGLLVAIVGLSQEGWKGGAGTGTVELINTIHLLLGIIAVGFGEMIAGRAKRKTKAALA